MIFFWKGRGFLIPLVAVAGLILGFMLMSLFVGRGSGMAAVVGAAWAAAGAVWLFGWNWGRTKTHVLLDPSTGQPVTVKEAHTFWFLTGTVWAVVLGVLAALLTLISIASPDGPSAPDTPGGQAFAEADELVRSLRDSGPFHGNDATAESLAAQFAETTIEVRAETIEQTRRPSVSLTKGEFLTYCHLDDKHAVFLIQIPGLRKFSDEAKEWMGSVCWWAACEVLDQHFSEGREAGDPPARLVVGLRGSLFYDRVLEGRFVPGAEEMDAGLENTTTGMNSSAVLIAFFETIYGQTDQVVLE